MLRITELRLPLNHPPEALEREVLARLGVGAERLRRFTLIKRNYDARKKTAVALIYTVDCEVEGEAEVLAARAGDRHLKLAPDMAYRFVARAEGAIAPAEAAVDRASSAVGRDASAGDSTTPQVKASPGSSARPRPLVIGFGPCGLFAALLLAQMGFEPIVLERGKAVRERTKDTWGLWRQGILDPESNVQFGEGGAGTFSDGKLWSQISDPRHLTRKVLDEFVKAGAPEEILYVGKPHIGTFRLVGVVEKMRAEIEALGGEIRFGHRVVDLLIEDGRVHGVRVATAARPDGETIATEHVVLAPGHSARDTFEMLHARGVCLEAKPFSIGFRIEHPQSLIDSARFGSNAGHPKLGAADYRLVHHAGNGRSVYSFCMCPGGTVVAATSEPGRVVTNGMSQYSRNERNANAAIVVGITPQDYRVPGSGRSAEAPVSPLNGIAFQRFWESRAFEMGGGNYQAPGQLVGDFIRKQPSSAFATVLPSYTPGVTPADLGAIASAALPDYAIDAIREALPAFEQQIKGYAMADAVLTGVETRTSSPLRISRGKDRQSVNVVGLYPAGEGAGYAGGIMSAAVDGIETAEAVGMAMQSSSARW